MYGLHSGTELVAGRAPKIGVEHTQGLGGEPHPGFSGSGRIRAARGERGVASDSSRDFDTDRERALNRPEKDKRAGFLSALQKATIRCGLAGADGHVSQPASAAAPLRSSD